VKKDEKVNKTPDLKGDKAVITINRRLNMLMMFDGKNKPLTTREITEKLNKDGDAIDQSLVLRTLKQLEEAGFLESMDTDENDADHDDFYIDDQFLVDKKNRKWRWPMGLDSRLKLFPKFSVGEIIAFRLMERLLKPLLPRESYEAIQPYLRAARKQCEILPRRSPGKAWEAKVRVVPPAQPLLPPEPPIHLASKAEREAWRLDQQRVRETLLEALLDDRQCRIEYRQIWRDEPASWTVHPLVYLQRGPAFYLLCTIDDYADVRQLAVHRMLSATVLDQKASKPDGFDVDREARRAQGMGGDGRPLRLVARFWRPAGSHLLETRLSADQIVGDEGDSHFRLTATVDDTAQLRWWLLSFGSKVEVLEPEGLREEMANNGYWMNRMYGRAGSPE